MAHIGGWAGTAALGCAVTGLLTARLLLAGPAFDRVWAEDGGVFLLDAQRHGWRSLGYAYAGYGHGVARGVALLGSALPLTWYAGLVVGFSLVAVGVVAAFTQRVAHERTGSFVVSLVPGLGMALLPVLGVESTGNLANLQWFLLVGAAWAGLRRPTASGGVLGFAAAVSSPLTVLVTPLLLVHGRTAWRHPAVAGIGAGLLFQVGVLLGGRTSALTGPPRVPGLPDRAVESFLGALLTDGTPLTTLTIRAGAVVLAVLVIALLATRRWPAAVLVGVAVLVFLVPTYYSGTAYTRYAAAPAMLLVSALALAAGPASAAVPVVVARTSRAAAGLVLVGIVVLGPLRHFVVPEYRVSGPSWSSSVRSAQDGCAEPGQVVELPVSPTDWGVVALSCSDT